MIPAALFHPAVARWFARSSPRRPRRRPGLAGDRGRAAGADRRPDRFRQDARRVSRRDRRARQAGARGPPRRRDADRLRLAAEGALERHPAQSRSRRSPASAPSCARMGLPEVEIRSLRAHRRHAAARARRDAPPPAAHHRHHPGIALHPARLAIRPRDAGDDAHRDRRRDPRGGGEQARRASRAVARAARRHSPATSCCAIGLSATQKPIEERGRASSLRRRPRRL